MGGKTRIAKQIAAVIDQYREPGQLVWDAFCGGLSVSVALSKKGPVLASDACAPLINLYKAVQEGWDPPTEVSKETWQAAKQLPDSDPMKAFCGFGCSYCGKWFGAYARSRVTPKSTTAHGGNNDFPKMARSTLMRDVSKINFIRHINFFEIIPRPTSSIIYIDPPYKNTAQYNNTPAFDCDLFLARVVNWSKFTDIFVSEYSFSLGKCVWSQEVNISMSGKSNVKRSKATEKLFHIPKQS